MTRETKLKISTNTQETPPIRTDMSITARPPASRPMETIQLTKRLQVTNSKGKVIYDTEEIPSHSFVVAFIQGLWACFRRINPHVTDIYGHRQPLVIWTSRASQLFRLDAGAGEARFGPVIGTGTTELSNHDTRLAAQIGHGTGTNQLKHEGVTITDPTEVKGDLNINIQRTYMNHSPATVTVAECGLYSLNHHLDHPRFHCIVRDLVSPAIDVPVGNTLLLEYRVITRV